MHAKEHEVATSKERTIEERVKKIVADQLGVKEEVVNAASFVEDLGADERDVEN